jgi:lysozyme family protein
MADFNLALQNTLDYEERIVECVEGDPGGRTIYGIDYENNKAWQGWAILDKMPIKTNKEVAKNAALQILILKYYKEIWDDICGDEINDQHLANYIFDSVINPGILTKKMVQSFVDVTIDGVFGAKTIAAINVSDAHLLYLEIKDWRIKYYNLRPAFISGVSFKSRFIKGWLNRANEVKE